MAEMGLSVGYGGFVGKGVVMVRRFGHHSLGGGRPGRTGRSARIWWENGALLEDGEKECEMEMG